jgi:hypothetical protein
MSFGPILLPSPLKLKGQDQWEEYCKSGIKPADIPIHPDRRYRSNWKDWPDWLGYEDLKWSIRRIKELLADLIRSRVIYEWDEAALYSLFLRKGLLNLHVNNRHRQFFKNLIEAARTEEGKASIEKYVNSASETPPDLSPYARQSRELTDELEPMSLSDTMSSEADPLDYGEIVPAARVLQHTNVLESINVDEEAMQFYVNYSALAKALTSTLLMTWKEHFMSSDN